MSDAPSVEGVVLHEVVVPVRGPRGSPPPPAWTGLPSKQEAQGDAAGVRPLAAHHRMLQEASAFASHLRDLKQEVQAYDAAAGGFFSALHDFLVSVGQPAAYENQLTEQGVAASKAAAAAAAAARTGALSASAAAAAGVAAATAPSSSSSADSAFAAPGAQQPRLPLLPTSGDVAAAAVCPGVPSTSALGVGGGLTRVAPSELLLPAQHRELFRFDAQKGLVAAGARELRAALRTCLLPALQLWLDTFEECKHLRAAADHAAQRLSEAKAAVVAREATHPLVPRAQLAAEGAVQPHGLVTTAAGMQRVSQGGGGAGAGNSSDELVAVPAREEREAMYAADEADTEASLTYELAEKAARERLRWLVEAGGALRALAAAGLAHALASAAAMGEPGDAPGGCAAAAAGAAAGAGAPAAASGAAGPVSGGGPPPAPLQQQQQQAMMMRALLEELFEPLPAHVLAHLRGEDVPTLPDLVLADHARLARWVGRYKAALAEQAAATAAAAGAQMLAAAAASGSAAAPAGPEALAVGGQQRPLFRTDEATAGGVAAGTATAVVGGGSSGAGGLEVPPATPAPPAPAAADTSGGGASASVEATQAALRRAAAELQLPLDLLAAAVAADMQEREAAAAAASKADLAYRLLHDASVVVGKEQAVLLPALEQAVGGTVPGELAASHARITDALTRLRGADPAAPEFDIVVLDVAEFAAQHGKVLRSDVLPALREAESPQALRALAARYRRVAASAPTRPHAWLLRSGAAGGAGAGDDGGGGGGLRGRAGRWVAAARGAAGQLAVAPVKAGARQADAAADAATVGVGSGAPAKVV